MSKISFLEAIKQAIIACKNYIDTKCQDLKKYVSDGKKLVATAITDKGVATEPTDTFATMAENIGQIESGSSFDSVIVSVDKFMINTSTLGCNVYLGEEE